METTNNARHRFVIALGIGALGLAIPATGWASTHVVILSAVHTTPKTEARMNVTGIDGGGVTFSVFPAGGGATIEDSVPLNPEFFATSASAAVAGIQNLFTGSNGATALVRASYTQGSAVVVLEQESNEGHIALGVPPLDKVMGPSFIVPIGDRQRGTTVLIGNPSGSPAAVILRYGQGPEEPPRDLPPFGAIAVDVTTANTQLKIRSSDASVFLIVQLAIDTGRTDVTFISPQQP